MVALNLQALAYEQCGPSAASCTTWVNTRLNGQKWSLPLPWGEESTELPETGNLRLTFQDLKERKPSPASDEQYLKLHSILAGSASNGTNDERRTGCLVIASTEMYSFTSSQAAALLTLDLGKVKVEAAARCLANLADPQGMGQVLAQLNKLEQKRAERILGQYFYFNIHNPTGHYRLNLEHKYDRLAATLIAKANRIERYVSKPHPYPDLP